MVLISTSWGFVTKTLAARTDTNNDASAAGDKLGGEEKSGEKSVIKMLEDMRTEMGEMKAALTSMQTSKPAVPEPARNPSATTVPVISGRPNLVYATPGVPAYTLQGNMLLGGYA